MSLLSAAFRAQAAKTKDIAQISEMTYNAGYPTGFLNLDFLNGDVIEINDKLYFQTGIPDGTIVGVISESGNGKTTFAIQAGANIIRPFKTSCMFIEAAEVGSALQRAMYLSGFIPEEYQKRVIARDSGITLESFQNRFNMIYDLKINNYDEYVYDTGIVDDYGKPVMKLEPTVMILDSLKMLLPEKLQDDSSNMSGAQTAKGISDMLIRMIPKAKQANIIIFVIAHITVDVNTGFMPKKSEMTYLKQGEHISGSSAFKYLQNNMLRIDRKSKLKPEEGFKISGTVNSIQLVKSRSAASGNAATLVFDQENGYDPDLSLFMMLKERGLLEGSGAFLKLPGCEIKFSQGTFKEKLYNEPELYNAFVTVCINSLKDELMKRHHARKKEEELSKTIKSPYEAILEQLKN